MKTIEETLLISSLILLLSIVLIKAASRIGIPSLICFIGLGMLMGSDGLGGIYFDNSRWAQALGVISLIFILFSGGLETDWAETRPIFWSGLALSTIGVLITTTLVGCFSFHYLRLPWVESLLLGSAVSSTDAAAVFSVFRGKDIQLKKGMARLLEFESGSNDPMAIFLTTSLIDFYTHKIDSLWGVIHLFLLEMLLGAGVGWLVAWFSIVIIKWLRLESRELYPVLIFGLVLLSYGLAEVIHGNGFLSVYIMGILINRQKFIEKQNVIVFHTGLAWLTQITMFVVLGLLVFPKELITISNSGLVLSAFILFIARPVAVHFSLFFSRFNFKEKTFISWTGLRGAAPIILATFPLISGIPRAEFIFNLVFFVVLSSVLIQGTSLTRVAQVLKMS